MTTAAPASAHSHAPGRLPALTLGALGVVFGDIGTSPLYALKESFVGHHPLAVDQPHIYGVLSLIFWTMTLIVTVKYVFIVMRADNDGEGGSMALLALVSRTMKPGRWTPLVTMLGVIATALFYGDAIITPAISVLSAVEGLATVEASFADLVLPIAIAILIGLFLIQKHGTDRVGILFGPVMAVYFVTLAVLGILNLLRHPEIIGIVNPLWAIHFFALDPKLAFLALGSVVLAVTGAEALYADMGHFGRKAISIAWLYAAFPCLLLNYMGQGALLLDDPAAAQNPFFLLAPEWARLPVVILATLATIIASQAVISGAFSVTRQAVQLGFLPRLRILHTSASAAGQIYVPLINWMLLILVIMLVIGFGTSSDLAAAYGIAVTGTMVITACMLGVLTFKVWRWHPLLAGGVTGLFLIIDGAYFLSNATKIPDGGWFPLLVALIVFVLLTTWSTGRKLMRRYLSVGAMDLDLFIRSTSQSIKRVPGTAIFLSSSTDGVPPSLLHNVKHNKILHQRVIILTVVTESVPQLPIDGRVEAQDCGEGFYRLRLRHGFMEDVDIPAAMKAVQDCGGPIGVMDTTYFLSRQTLIASDRPGMAIWREKLFAWMIRNAESPMQFFRLPTNRLVELGSQIEI
ncbi:MULTISPECIES: potassium transporter Kup [unclassified Sphingobium]|uniref:potassium transporter Kup n=1 Tax=unclassified Sphingobium TaxID=2611147 RepID=UPI0035A62933